MGWATGAWATGAWAGTAWAQQSAPVEVPDVVGESEANGTSTLEGAGFAVAVQTAYSSTVEAGLIVSQSPAAGSFVNSGSTVTITVSLGPEPIPEEPIGGHFLPQKDYRPELDEKRLRDERELRELIERAAGLIAEVEESEPEPEIAAQVVEVKGQLETLAEVAFAPEPPTVQELSAAQERVDRAIEKAADDLIVQVADVLTDLINEIAEDQDAA